MPHHYTHTHTPPHTHIPSVWSSIPSVSEATPPFSKAATALSFGMMVASHFLMNWSVLLKISVNVGVAFDIHDLRLVYVFFIADLIEGMFSAEGLSRFIRVIHSPVPLLSPWSCSDLAPVSRAATINQLLLTITVN